MAVQFILGGPGTGKTTRALSEIREVIARADGAGEGVGGNTPLYYLVPEQFSLQAERLLLSGEGSREAATQVQVLSFNRLAYRLFAALGGPPGQHADDLAKQMLLQKVLLEVAGELEFYQSSAAHFGFVTELAATITEMNHYRVSVGDLRDRAEKEPPAFAAKLRDTALILEKYRAAIRGRYLITDEMPEILCERLAQIPLNEPLPLLDGACFWVDGFSGFTPQERQVLLHIMKRAGKVTFIFTTMKVMEAKVPPEVEVLEALALDAHLEILEKIYLNENFRHADAPGLAYFVDNYGSGGVYGGGLTDISQNIELIAANDRYSAVYAAAERVMRLVGEKGYRFRDIAVLCGDRGRYEKILQTVFDRAEIPMFVDTETDILSHPLTEMIRAALDIPVRNWSFESVVRFLKTRLAGVGQDAADVLENYALANGINSYRWRYVFNDETAESGRKLLLDALAAYRKTRAETADTVKNHARRVFDMLYACGVPETLQGWFDSQMRRANPAAAQLQGENAAARRANPAAAQLQGANAAARRANPAAARLHGQIWPKICEIFDKLVEILGNETVTHKTFAAMLDAGLCQVGLGRIPPTTDQVVLGDITRSRYPQIRAMLVLGANDGSLPLTPAQSGILTDYERKILKNSALELAPENFSRISEQNFNLYTALSQPAEKLVFIYAESEPNGKPLRPAPIIFQIQKMFPQIKKTPAPVPAELPAENSVFFAPVTLSADTAGSLYGKAIYTAATRLEAFARCPFAYFADYVLGARPRKQYEVLPGELGGLFHDVIAGFTAREAFEKFSREETDRAVAEIVGGLTLEDSVFHSTARNKYILQKVQNVAAASCRALVSQLKGGDFKPEFSEHEITAKIALGDGRSLALSGRIDRVDIRENGAELVKIIDYKSGNAKFSREDALRGVQLQLMLYMDAFVKSRENAVPAGVFYFPVDDPIINADDTLTDAAREEALLKCFKMSGLEIGGGPKNETPAAFRQFAAEVESKARELGTRMARGDISARPYTRGPKSPCGYCKFSGICAAQLL